jgi:aminoglycoside phosphotransferase family enzyme/predicted kinase
MVQNSHKKQIDMQNPTDQSEAIRFLEGGADRGSRAIRIDTHGAVIFLIGDQAFKIKRAVKYDYMDLSTLEKRRTLLDREFELNRDGAPSIYRRVIPLVRQTNGALALDKTGEILEWVLWMNRFAPQAELTNIAKTHGISDGLAQDLGVSIARYHKKAAVKTLDGATLICEILDELDRVFNTMSDSFHADARSFVAKGRKACAMHTAHFQQRTNNGFIRRCHGDLHLRNIIMIDGVPTPIDALEFDERLGTCDTFYDLAFLLMDLDHQGMPHAANLVLNAYLGEQNFDLSDAGLALLPLYLSIRAAIRAMVDVQTAAVSANGKNMLRDARAYLRQALEYLDHKAPILVAIGGYSGTGKTTIARAVAHHIGAAPGAIHLRSDVLRKTLLNRKPLDHLGPDGYTPHITARTYETMRQQAKQVLDQGHSAIIDAVHSNPKARAAVKQIATSAGCAFVGIWLESPTQTRLARVASRGPDASDADADVVNQQATTDPGPIGWHRIATNQTQEAVIKEVLAELKAVTINTQQTCGAHDVG